MVLVVDGKKVFPIGFTMPPPPDALAPNGKNGIAELSDAGGDIFVLACKREGDTKQFRFSGLSVASADGDVLFESARTVALKDGSWTDWFGPFEVHVYRFSRR